MKSRILLFAVLFSFGTSLVGSLGVYISTYYVFAGDQAKASVINGIAGTIGLGLAIASLPLFNLLSRRVGKTRTLFLCLGLQLLAKVSVWFTYVPEAPWLIVVNNALIFVGNAGLWVMLPSMLADVVDEDELSTGERREGSYAAVFSWVLKVSMTLGLAFSGPVLELTGFRADAGPVQPPEVLDRMRLFMSLGPTVLLVVAGFVLARYRLGPERMAEIRARLDARKP